MADELTAGQKAYRARVERLRAEGRREAVLEHRESSVADREAAASRTRSRTVSAPSLASVRPSSGGFSNPANSRKLVLVSMLGLLILNVYRGRQADQSLYKRLWGTGVLAFILSVLADFAPTVAGPFGLLVLLGAFTHGGDQALQNALGTLAAKVPSTGRGPSAAQNVAAKRTASGAPTKPGAQH